MEKALKDNLPFMLFLISGYLLIFHQGWPLTISSAMFYGAGSVMLVSRSAQQRLDLENKRKIKHHMPEVIYEYSPYWYIATSVFLLLAFINPFVQFAAFILIIVAVRNLLLRHNNRVKAPRKF